jgi:hypothetical protein
MAWLMMSKMVNKTMRRLSAIASSGLYLILLSAAPVPATCETIQLEQQHGLYLVPVRINGAISLPFFLDSGATAVVIPRDVFSRFGELVR